MLLSVFTVHLVAHHRASMICFSKLLENDIGTGGPRYTAGIRSTSLHLYPRTLLEQAQHK